MQRQGVNFWGRRRFLRQTVTTAGAGVLVLLAAGERNGAESQSGQARADELPAPQGYRLTDHIRTYYATLRS